MTEPGTLPPSGVHAELTDRVLAEALPSWPDRWSYPGLVSRLAAGQPVTAEQLAELVLEGLARPRTVLEAVEHLLREEDFRAVQLVADEAGLPTAQLRQVLDRLEAARRSTGEALTRSLHLLRRRAHELDVQSWPERESGYSDMELATLAAEDTETLRGLLRGWEKEAADEETARRAELLERLAQQGEVSESVRDTVRECLDAGEFRVAEGLLGAEPLTVPPEAGPRGWPRNGRPWSWSRYPLDEVLGWYREASTVGSSAPGLDGWRPSADDAAGWELIDALSELSRLSEPGVAPALSTARRLVHALHRCIGSAEAAAEARPEGQGVVSRLYWPGDHRLPPLGLLERTGVALWIAPSTVPPPDTELPRPIVWLVPESVASGPVPAGCALLTGTDLLRLAAPGPSVETSEAAPARQIALLRMLGPQLGLRGLLDGESGGGRGVELPSGRKPALLLSWLLDLLGFRTGNATLEALLYETGGHRRVLRELLEVLCARPGGTVAPVELRLTVLDRFRQDLDWRRHTFKRLMEQLAEDEEAVALLFTVVWLYAAGDRTNNNLVVLTGDAESLANGGGLPTSLDFEGAAERLVAAHLLARSGEEYALPANGLRDLLSDGSDTPPEARVADALNTLRERSAATDAQAIVAISMTISEMIDHYNGNLTRDIQSALEIMLTSNDEEQRRRQFEEVTRLQQQQQPLTELQEQAFRPPEPQELRTLLTGLANKEVIHSRGRDHTTIDCPERLRVRANRWLLQHLLWILLDNARRAIDQTGAAHGFIEIRAAEETTPDGRRWCRIEIEDSGCGLAEGVAARLNAGERLSTRGSGGQGLAYARALIREYRGTLQVLDQPTELGGALVRIRMPLVPAPGS